MTMSGPDLRLAGQKLYGERGWRAGLAELLEMSEAHISRMISDDKVTGAVSAAVALKLADLERQRQGGRPDPGFWTCRYFDVRRGECRREGNCLFDLKVNRCKHGKESE